MNAPKIDTLTYDSFKNQISFGQVASEGFRNRKLALSVKISCFVMLLLACFFTLLIVNARTPAPVGVWFLALGFVLIPALILAAVVAEHFKKARQRLRMQQFAKQNDFTFDAKLAAHDYPGVIFGIGDHREFENVVSGKYQNLPFALGNYTYMTGSGRSRQTHTYGLLRITLSRHLPHILLDSKDNNLGRLSNLQRFHSQQKLQLEGNFNTYFDLYVPEGYERDALYFITPELMGQLIDYGAKFDIELIDNYLCMYSTRPFVLEKEEALRGIFNIINIIGSEVQENTARYSDARIGDRKANIVAEPGRRLKKTFSWIGIVLVIAYLLWEMRDLVRALF